MDVEVSAIRVLGYQHTHISQLDFAVRGKIKNAVIACGEAAQMDFRTHLRVPQDALLSQVITGLQAGNPVIVEGDRGTGKSVFAGELFDELHDRTGIWPLYIQAPGHNRESDEHYISLWFESAAQEIIKILKPEGKWDPNFVRFLHHSASPYFSDIPVDDLSDITGSSRLSVVACWWLGSVGCFGGERTA